MERKVDVAIIGAGSAGLYALGQVRKHTDNWVLINGGELGTTCARVGCMPSKAAIQVAEDFHRRKVFDRHGIEGSESLSMDLPEAMEHVRDLRDIFVDRVLEGSTDMMGAEFMEGYARFIEPNVLDVEGEIVHADKVIIATGSRPVVPAAWEKFRDRVITTDDFFELEHLPASVAVIGLGAIGLELGQALSRMGVKVTGIDQADRIAGLQDPVANKTALNILGGEFDIWLGATAEIEMAGDQLRIRSDDREVLVDRILASLGRTPNLDRLDIAKLGVELDDRGVPQHDPSTMQVGDLPVFIAGDVTGTRPILHEAGDEGRIAGVNAVSDQVRAFRRKTPLAITFCDPNIAVVGAPLDELDPETTVIGEMQLGPVGRALIMAKNKGVVRVYADKHSGRLLGGTLVAPKAESLAHLLAWSVQWQKTVFDLLTVPFYHPTVEETLQAALYDLKDKVDGHTGDAPELRPLS